MRSVEVRNHKKDEAVSPVVGVMLMLVVTIVIAAVVAMFATGVFSETKTASTAVIELVDDKPLGTDGAASNPKYWLSNMKFAHKGGDILNVDELTLKITYNGVTASNSFSIIKKEADKTTWSVGEKLEVKKLPETGLGPSVLGTTSYYTWSITDGSGLVIASGTKYFDFNGDSEIPVSTITISGVDSVDIDDTITLTANIQPAEATVKTVTWSSLNTSIATVNESGVVTGVGAGNTYITATATDGSGVMGQKEITVNDVPKVELTFGTCNWEHNSVNVAVGTEIIYYWDYESEDQQLVVGVKNGDALNRTTDYEPLSISGMFFDYDGPNEAEIPSENSGNTYTVQYPGEITYTKGV